MKVKELAAVASCDEWMSVEDDNYNVFAFDEAQFIAKDETVANMVIDCFYGGIRNNKHGIIVIVK